jgi:hypothetical protein
MRLSLNMFMWRSHQQVWGIEWKKKIQSISLRYKASEDLVLKCSF